MRKLPRTPPPPLEGPTLKRHFEAMRQILWARYQLSGQLSPTTTGNAREWFVKDFVQQHLPGSLRVGSGHLLYDDGTSRQQDAIVFKDSGLALPVGQNNLVFPEGAVACIEVKSTLSQESFVNEVASNFRSLRPPQPLKVLVAYSLENNGQHRRLVAQWALKSKMEPNALPDLLVILDNSAIVRGNALTVLKGLQLGIDDENRLYKFGSYDNDKWLPLALLAFELAQRLGVANWIPYLDGVLPKQNIKALPDT